MGARTYWVAPLPPFNAADGTANATVSLTDISPGGTASQKTTYAGTLEIGTKIRLSAYGEYSCGSTATNIALGFYYGGAAGIALAAVTAQALTVSQTSVPWEMHYIGEIRQLGSSGSIKGSGHLLLATSLTAYAAPIPIPSTLALRTVAIDTTTNKILTVASSVSQTTGAPTVTCYSMSCELIA